MSRSLLIALLLNWNCASLLTVPIYSIVDTRGKLHEYSQELPQGSNVTTLRRCKIHNVREQITIDQSKPVVYYSIKRK
jgi:hypothetical protein